MPKPLEVTQPNDREVRVVRSFNAPAKLVWDAHTKPELVQKWMHGYDGWSMPVCEMDVREGGAYRWRWRNDADGKEFGFYGEFTEVKPTTRIVHKEYFDPGDAGTGETMTTDPCIVASDYVEANGVTTLTMTMTFVSKEARDGAVATGMTDGMEFSYKRLDDHLTRKAA